MRRAAALGLLLLNLQPAHALRLPPRFNGERAKSMGTLILVRHGDTQWDRRRRFTGWADPGLSEAGEQQASQAARALLESGYTFDVVYTSVLKRAVQTTWLLLKELSLVHITVHKDWRLNERSYGAVTGRTHEEACREYGQARVASWRRSFVAAPPDYPVDHPHSPAREARYLRWQESDGSFAPVAIPGGESLGDTIGRCLPVWRGQILSDLREGKRVLVVAHGNTIRAIMQAIDGVDDADVANLEVPLCIPLVYRFDRTKPDIVVVRPETAQVPGLSGEYLADDALLREAQQRMRQASLNRYGLAMPAPDAQAHADSGAEAPLVMVRRSAEDVEQEARIRTAVAASRRRQYVVIVRHGKTEHNK
jgi:2,3-bisphosphoglycerate-dependent phosphoglycerate mutase